MLMELLNTISPMVSADYKERFLAEYLQDRIRYEKLLVMVEKWDKGELNFTPTCPREIYDRQLKAMKEKLDILEERAKLEGVELGEMILTGKTFGEALEALKRGRKVARKGWNGKGMWLWLKESVTIKAEWCKDPELKKLVEANGGEIEALGTICMKTADNKVLTGWLASQTDMLSNDWIILEEASDGDSK